MIVKGENLQDKKYLSSDEVYEDLCEKIEKLEYMPGYSISENELASVYDVSRHTIRNAIIRLKERRLVDVYPQRGTFVSLIDMKFVKDVLYLRESVEQESLMRIMNLDDEKRNALVTRLEKNIVEQKEKYHQQVTMEAFNKLDIIFHYCLMHSIDKERVMDIVKEQYIHVKRWKNFEVSESDRIATIIEEHEQIIEAIKNVDAEMGRENLHIHLDTVTRYQDKYKASDAAKYFIF